MMDRKIYIKNTVLSLAEYFSQIDDKSHYGSTHSFEIDFLITSKNKIVPIEVKSSAVKNHKTIDNFEVKYSKYVGDRYLLSQKDVGKIGTLKLKPIYMVLFLLKDL